MAMEPSEEEVRGEAQGQAEPEDLAQAFKMYRERNAQVADEGVPAGEPGEERLEGEPGDGEPVEERDLGEAGGYGGVGGYAASDEEDDWSYYGQTLADEIGRAAISTVQRKFAEQGIQKVTISQLYQRDERTGSVSFVNPDDPNRPFMSRADAQAWCNAFNQDVEAEFRKAAIEERNSLARQYRPAMELIEFAPKFAGFDKLKQDVVNDMIEPYEVKDASGAVIGYSCDLDAVAARADKLIERFAPKQREPEPQPQQPAPATGPALDMKGSGSSGGGKPPEPKNLAEAMKMYQEQTRKKGR